MVELRMNQGGPPLRTQLESIMFQISPVLRLRMVTQSFQSKDTPFSFLYSDSEPPPQQFFNESVVTDLLDRISELRTILQTDPTSPTPQVLPPQTNVTFDIHPASIPKQDESEAPSGSTALSKQKSLLGAFFEHLSFQDIINQFMKFYVFTQRIPESWRLPAFPTLLRLSGKVFHFLASDTDSTTDVKISNELMSIVCHFTSVLNVSPSPHFMQDLLMRTDLVTLTSDARSALVNSFVTLQKLLETKGAVERKRVAKVPVQRLIQPEVKKPDETGAGKRSLPFQFTINTEDTTMKHIISLTQHFETEQKENVEEESEEIIETISLSILRSPDSVDKTEIDRILELPMIVPQPVIDSPPTIPTLHELISSTLPHPTALSAETQFDLASLQELFLADDNLIFFLDTFEGRLKSSRACCTVPMTTPLPLTTQSLRVHPQQSFDLYMLANYHVLLSLFFLIEGLVSESLYAAVTASNNIHDYVLERGLSDYVNRGMGIGLVVFLFHIVSHTFLPQLGPDENSFRNTPGFGEPGSSTHMWKHMDASKSMMSWKQPIDKLINLFSSPPPFAPSAQDLPPGSVTEHRKKLSAQLLVTMPPQTVVGLFRALLILTRVLSIFSIIQPHISAIIKIPFVVLQHINNLITESEKEKTSPSEQTIRVEPADKAENDEADSDGMEDAPSPEPTPAFTQAKTEYEMQLNHVANIVKTDPHILALLREVLKEIKESQVTPEKIRESVAARMKDHGIPAQQVLTESDVMTAKLKPIEADEHIKKLKRVAPVKGSQAHRKERKEKENRARMADPLLHSFLLPPTGSAQLPHRSMNLLPVPRRPQSINVAQSSIFQTQLPLFPQVEPPSPLSRPTSPATLDHSLHSHSLSSLSGDSPLFYGLSSMTPDSNSLSFGFFDSPSLTSRMINSPSFYTQPSYSPSASTFPYSLLSNMDDGAAFNLLPNASSNLNQAAKAQSITSPNFQLAFRSLGKIEKEDDGWD
ncbi:hypothetical protein BLNAU_16620 [Blattamonas nauphoetae]|uniref:Uncharacterized protein n=1 Tax=Blattamonas nauphoetae TaxID=2049346 RepID=A0ABQ9XAV4_9EUKA|nr:hypothetical protein BLNAU_16620 [Blattamonas nauphoetae]